MEPKSGWKEFTGQVVTIACGVLLALLVAAGAARVQKVRARKGLDYSLHWEAEKNQAIAAKDIKFLDGEMSYSSGVWQALRSGQALPAKTDSGPYRALSTTAWKTAKEDGSMSVIPAQAEHLNAVLYMQADAVEAAMAQVDAAAKDLADRECGDSDRVDGNCTPDVPKMTEAERSNVAVLAAKSYRRCAEAKAKLAVFARANDAVLSGKAKSEEELIAAIER